MGVEQQALSHIAVIGAGAMGSGIAQLFARHAGMITVIDPYPEALERARREMKAYCAAFFLDETGMAGKIIFSTEPEAAASAKIVIEAAPEQLEIKHDLFSRLERICAPTVIFATNTSGLPINRIAQVLQHRHRFLGMHFFTPASVIPLVEVVRGDATSDEVVQTALDVLRHVGKHPVVINKDIPGFIANRIQHALAREAMSLLEKGVASAEDIDDVVKWSLGIRLVFTGPLEQRDINGLDIHYAIASYLYQDLENRTIPSALLHDTVAAGHLGMKTGRGFYSWDGKNIEEEKKRKNRALLALIAWLQAYDLAKGD